MRCTGVILAGGQASRFGGRAKGLEVIGQRRIIDRVADALRSCTDELLLVANAPDATEWLPGVRVTADMVPGHGSLSGVHAALVHAETPVLVVAWDMPFVSTRLLSALRALGETSAHGDAAAPTSSVSNDGPTRCEPLCAWYSPRALAVIERRLRDGDHRMMEVLRELDTQCLPHAEVSRFGDPRALFMNVNTNEELLEARRIAGGNAVD